MKRTTKILKKYLVTFFSYDFPHCFYERMIN